MKYDLAEELAVTSDGAVRTVLLNRAAELNCVNENLHWALANVALGGPLQAGFSAGVATMQTEEHRVRLADFQRRKR
jgi:hypothetical protein